ncbi:5'/3'-nucleotidase SurE [Rhizobiales bacterium]|uniref:5'/3'-nucleotidase SurE n=1 Tax=Hongsoonwoonella zoysiae TaxID=2821844 RepID=UPI00155FA20C|nr:5'/3'-nucleotidase SurE [Hongsoonwoonella zoysiae]NRG18864.1 5'/3'-nucleotidase SurE [Hongsoonwoonella zoysiae]
MRILLTNDDGINAEGFEALRAIAGELSDDVWCVAPETDQSGTAHSLTLHDPLRVRKIDERRFAVRGTPTDCVIMGVRELMDGPPDLVLSGVNRGQNVADDVTYSGTIAGAMEGILMGVRSIALSQAYSWKEGQKPDFRTATTHAPGLIRRLLDIELPGDTLLNVNFPAVPAEEVAGIDVTRQGKREVGALYVDARVDGRGVPYYWLAFKGEEETPAEHTDLGALRAGYISITPMKLDLTAESLRDTLVTALK